MTRRRFGGVFRKIIGLNPSEYRGKGDSQHSGANQALSRLRLLTRFLSIRSWRSRLRPNALSSNGTVGSPRHRALFAFLGLRANSMNARR